MTIQETAREFETAAEDHEEYAAAFAAAVRERRAASDPWGGDSPEDLWDGRTPADVREGIERKREEFAAASEEFGVDREAFAREVTRRRQAFAASAGAIDDYVAAFEADVQSFAADAGDRRAAVESFLERIADAEAAFAEYADAFAADVETRRGAVDGSEFETAAREFARAREQFRETVAEFWGTDPGELLASGSGGQSVDSPTGDRETVTGTGSGGGGDTSRTGTGSSDPTDDAPPETDAESPGSTTFDREVPGGETEPATAVADPDPGSSTAGDDRAGEAPTGEETGEDPATSALRAELREIQYAKLKKAANRIGYEDNLNAATKDELVEFIAANADRVEEALDDA